MAPDVVPPAAPSAEVKTELGQVLGLERGKFLDARGKIQTLYPLTLADYSDIEKEYGSYEKLIASNKATDSIFLIWLSLRKGGLTEDEMDAAYEDSKKWKLPRIAVGKMFNMGDLEQMKKVIQDIFIVSGFKEELVKKVIAGVAAKLVNQKASDLASASPTKLPETPAAL